MSTSHTILIVDDDPTAAELVAVILAENPDYQVQTAHGASEGLALAEKSLPELIISDLRMKEKDGMELCHSIRAHAELRDSMFLMMTGAAEMESRVSAIDVGADDYITKPIHPLELQSKVRALLRMRSMQDQLKNDRKELARLNEALQEQFAGVMKLLVNMISIRVPGATARADRACAMAEWIGQRMGMDDQARKILTVAARLREIGKTVLPDELLSRPTPELGDEDRSTLQQFPVFGQMLVASIPELKGVDGILRHQLENHDGSGTPDRLRREDIPVEARILRAVEFVERLPRNGTAPSGEAVLEELEKARGSVLDPAVAQLTIEYLGTTGAGGWMEGAREVTLEELEEGMVVAMDVVTSGGVKLLSRGVHLTRSHIDRIQGHHRSDPIMARFYIESAPGEETAA
jgi:putative two-component system response regulator